MTTPLHWFPPPYALRLVVSEQFRGETGINDDEPVRVLAIGCDESGHEVRYLAFHSRLPHPRVAEYKDVQRLEYADGGEDGGLGFSSGRGR